MLFWSISFVISFVASFFLLKKPYLRETTIGWLLAIWALPYVGSIILFTMVVRSKEKTHHHSEHRKDNYEYSEGLTQDQKILEKIGVRNGFSSYGNIEESIILRDDEFFEELIKQVEQAEKSIWICTYILSGEAKEILINRLFDAHERGVEIKLLVDRIGSGFLLGLKSKREYLNFPFETAIFRKSLMHSLMYIEKRLHSKIAIFDSHSALIGSHNIRDEIQHDAKGFARNISLLFSGTVITQLEDAYADLFQDATGIDILKTSQQEKAKEKEGNKKVERTNQYQALDKAARIIYSDPLSLSFQYNEYVNSVFFSGQKRMYIWMPYMIPSDILRTSIINAHKTGVDVKVLFPIKTDSKLVDNAHQLVLNELTDHGVPCAASTGAFDHSKIFIIDNITMLGSTNLDHRSLYRNYEANIEINNRGFTDKMCDVFIKEFEQSKKIERTHPTRKRTIVNQVTSLISTLY